MIDARKSISLFSLGAICAEGKEHLASGVDKFTLSLPLPSSHFSPGRRQIRSTPTIKRRSANCNPLPPPPLAATNTKADILNCSVSIQNSFFIQWLSIEKYN
jgi:hypothetical protein